MTNTAQPKPLFATLAHGKLKHRTDVVAARMHNNREMDCENVDQDGPKPKVVFGPEDTWAGVKGRLKELGIIPRKNAVHALELVMGASEDWWMKEENAQLIQRMAFQRMVEKYLRGRFPAEAVISLTWHLDECNPHLHAVVLPIRKRVDGRFRDGRERWSLSARGDLSRAAKGPDGKPLLNAKGKKVIVPAGEWRGGMGGVQQLEKEQTIFAETMAPLKLVRGKEKSRADDGKSTREYRAELIAKTAGIGVERAGLQDARLDFIIEDHRQRQEAAELRRLREELESERSNWAASTAAREAALAAERFRFDADVRASFIKTKAERDDLRREQAEIAAVADRQAENAAELNRRTEELDAERSGWAASIAAREAALAAGLVRLEADRLAMDERGRNATKWKRQADARDTAQNERAAKLRDADDRLDERAGDLAELVEVVTRAVATVDPEQLPAANRQGFYDAARELGVSIKRAARTSAVIAGTAAARGTWQGYQPGA